MLPRALLVRSRHCSGCLRASTSAPGSHDVESDTSKSQERFGKHEASEVAFSPTRLEDITHNYARASDDEAASVPAEHVGENADAYSCGSNVSLYAHMQSNVPEPFEAESPEAPTSLNMPGGGGQSTSYMYLSGKRSSAK
ncbi:uncharacterized protein LOC119404017 [Rhipicephalus sanguineus]|uniref:Uncharacterized protein n=1 Tax=Rhipicephalus sanguineus TaxID=34632 RepID=A0A9D4YR56_RHISA|nr:uncharacterized protein LOC119376281 [Rhipicephalus sanguineus]XP_037526573.1 uncharacterized protein LOC119404017 [Rhipicephalus sanguineus]KAH7935484.1 hypothetical protein HPB52_008451 [Rhipicephalus sanguineus]KAH7984976.1 hypothetical protein HPB52_024403 [Rhipicephalus sanguineus]